MKHRLNLDTKDPNYTLLKEIFKIMDLKNFQTFCFLGVWIKLTNKYF